MKIFHIINSINSGGAENVLLKLCSNSQDQNNKHYVVSLIKSDELIDSFQKNCEELFVLNFNKNFYFIFEFLKLLKIIKRIKPDILIGWMYHSSLVAFFCYKLSNIKKIYWNIRHTQLIFSKSSLITIIICKLMAIISKFSNINIIYCSDESAYHHFKIGFNNNKSNIIYNGVDVNKFKYSQTKDDYFKIKHNIHKDEFIIGMIANYRPQKNHKLLFESLSLLKNNSKNFKIILAGRNITYSNIELLNLIKKNNISENVILLDNVKDVKEILSSFDILLLTSSHGESFSNVLIEAMSTSIPCISTNIGASKFIINDCGWICDSLSKNKFYDKILNANVLKNNVHDWNLLKNNNRNRVVNNFSLDYMIKKYEGLFNI